MYTDEHNHAAYLTKALDPQLLEITIGGIKTALENIEFDYIVCRGLSGIIPASIVAYEMKKKLIVIRKGESCHSGVSAEGKPLNIAKIKYVIIDDLISSGDTVENIISAMDHLHPVLIVLYSEFGGKYNNSNYCGIPVYHLNHE